MEKQIVFSFLTLTVLVLAACGSSPSSSSGGIDSSYIDFSYLARHGDLTAAERILKEHSHKWGSRERDYVWSSAVEFDTDNSSSQTLRIARLLRQYNVGFGDSSIVIPLANKRSEELVRYLMDIGMSIPDSAIYYAIDGGYSDSLIQTLLDKGAKSSGPSLRVAAEKRKWSFIPTLLKGLSEDDLNYRYTRTEYDTYYNSQTQANRQYIDPYNPARSKTALMFAAEAGNFSTVRLLLDSGARVNLRADDGSTAASLAYDNGEIEIYNYLVANGAIDFEPRQVTQVAQATPPPQQAAPVTVYVEPYYTPPPSTPAPVAPVAPATPTLRGGVYAYTGTNILMEINLTTYLVSAYVENRIIANGSCRISGDQLVLSFRTGSNEGAGLRGNTYAYTITSNTSFSGSGENWVYRGGIIIPSTR
jgi:hypothetical protein